MDKSRTLHQEQEDIGKVLHNIIVYKGKETEFRQELENVMTTFARLNLHILQSKLISSDTLFTCCFLLFSYYTLNTWTVPLHLPFSWMCKNLKWAQRSLTEVAHLFCLFVCLDDPPLLACLDTGKMERGKKGKALIYLHLSDSLEHENNIKNGSITYRLLETIESGCEFSIIHPTALGEPIPFLPLVCQFMKSPFLCFFLYTLSHPRTLNFALRTEAMTHSLWLN